MTEREWLACQDPDTMLRFMCSRAKGPATPRKLNLFALACCRRIPSLKRAKWSHRALEIAESIADGVWLPDFKEAYRKVRGFDSTVMSAAKRALFLACSDGHHEVSRDVAMSVAENASASFANGIAEARRQCDILRCMYCYPSRRVIINPAWLTWRDATVPKIAQAAYDERELPSGELNRVCLAVLADALEEAGCTNADIVAHLRSPGPHVRGCWVVDLLLRKA